MGHDVWERYAVFGLMLLYTLWQRKELKQLGNDTAFILSLAILSYSQIRTNYLSDYFVERSEVSLVMEKLRGAF